MKQIITLLLLTAVLSAKSQNYCGEVIYKEEINFKYPSFVSIYKTQFNDKSCFTNCMTRKIVISKKDKTHEKILKEYFEGRGSEHKTEYVNNVGIRLPYYYLTKRDSYFAFFCNDIDLYVKEDPFKWDWKLLGETKKIGKYICKKATIRFRKRNFIAWYTTDIPSSFGPKKFKGLPGFILQVHDEDMLWSISAVKVTIANNKKCVFNEKDISKFNKTIDIVTYLKERDEAYKRELIRYGTKMGIEGRKTPYDNYHARVLYNGAREEIFDKYPLVNKKNKKD